MRRPFPRDQVRPQATLVARPDWLEREPGGHLRKGQRDVAVMDKVTSINVSALAQRGHQVFTKGLRQLISLGLAAALGSCGTACLSTPLGEIHGPAGIIFKVTRTDCDTLAKDSAVSVIATRSGDKASGLLVKYDPWGDELPQVHVAEGGTIFIHIARASSILEQHQTWGSFKVKVEIDQVAYPGRR